MRETQKIIEKKASQQSNEKNFKLETIAEEMAFTTNENSRMTVTPK